MVGMRSARVNASLMIATSARGRFTAPARVSRVPRALRTPRKQSLRRLKIGPQRVRAQPAQHRTRSECDAPVALARSDDESARAPRFSEEKWRREAAREQCASAARGAWARCAKASMERGRAARERRCARASRDLPMRRITCTHLPGGGLEKNAQHRSVGASGTHFALPSGGLEAAASAAGGRHPGLLRAPARLLAWSLRRLRAEGSGALPVARGAPHAQRPKAGAAAQA